MGKKPKTETINDIIFHIPADEVFCKKCKTTNYFYDDDLAPFYCDNCGIELNFIRPQPPMDSGPNE